MKKNFEDSSGHLVVSERLFGNLHLGVGADGLVDGLSYAHVVRLPVEHVLKDDLLYLAVETLVPLTEGVPRGQEALHCTVGGRADAVLPEFYERDVEELVLDLEDQVEAGEHMIDEDLVFVCNQLHFANLNADQGSLH